MSVIRLDTAELDRIVKQLGTNRRKIGKRIAFEIEKEAKQLAPVDTGALRASIYTVTEDYNGYASAAGGAKKNPSVETAPHPVPTGNIVANVGPCVDYAEYVEFPGVTRNFAGRPFLTPAVEKVAQKYNDGSAWKELVE